MQFTSIGKRSLKEGESLSLSIGREKVVYERVVEWNVASDESGSVAEETWDVLHFKNPFTFPMTAAPAMVMEKGQFNGQRACYWANVGEETSLRITRSLSVRTLAQEREDVKKDKLETIKIGNATYQLVTVQGELIVNNHRKQAVPFLQLEGRGVRAGVPIPPFAPAATSSHRMAAALPATFLRRPNVLRAA